MYLSNLAFIIFKAIVSFSGQEVSVGLEVKAALSLWPFRLGFQAGRSHHTGLK